MKRILLTAEGAPTHYLKALKACGAEGISATAETDLLAFDGLLLCGGGDPDPALFGEKIRVAIAFPESGTSWSYPVSILI